MRDNWLATLTDRVAAVCPINGLSHDGDGRGIGIQFADGVTDEQIKAANLIISTYDPNAPTPDEIATERNRRLGLGFDYNFGDARGVHHIGTTKRDLEGWDEVSKYAGALIDAGQTSTTIHIATDTGPCTVTPIEWRAIEIASAAFRQPLWAKSFALMALAPTIPADYTHDSYWS